MKRVLCLLLLLLLLCPAASAREDYDDLYVRILGLSAGGPTYDEGFDALPEAAQALYAQLGFRLVGRRKDYYRLPREDALILKRELKEA